ncbi:hypothetical protein FIS3754_44730 [Fischerella sp. NIES-3754]|nr:hypothetical protein FIS3754_44730 [Fischerella sp. NIES-3754]BCX10903.1 MAG: hypothetical protein KatS3mg066_4762 [Fischerella sp.]
MQGEHLNILLEMVLRTTDVPQDARTLAWFELRQLRQAIDDSLKHQNENLDIYTLAHLEETSDRSNSYFNYATPFILYWCT